MHRKGKFLTSWAVFTVVGGASISLARQRFEVGLGQAQARLDHPAWHVRTFTGTKATTAYVDHGTGPAVLVLHGNNGGWDQSMDWAQRRLPTGFRIIAPSRFGYPGSSIPPAATTAGQAEALAELLEHLDLAEVAVVSLSAGANVAARLAVAHPERVRALVLESPVVPGEAAHRMPPEGLTRAMVRNEYLFWALTRMPWLIGPATGVPWKHLDAGQKAELSEIMTTLTPVKPRAEGMLLDSLVAIPEIARDEVPWEQIKAPTLLVTAAHEATTPVEDAVELVDRLQNGRLITMPTGGHLLLGNVEALRTVLSDFLGG